MKYWRQLICTVIIFSILLTMEVPAAKAASALTTEASEPAAETEVSPETTEETMADEAEETTSSDAEPSLPAETDPVPEPDLPDDAPEETLPEEAYSQSSSMCFGTEKQEEPSREVPLYLQTDYPDTPYSDGTLATSGCTITCISMVAAGMSGQEVKPDALARRFNNYDASNLQRMEAASTVLDLTYEKTSQWEDVMAALEENKLVIVLLSQPSEFTASQHMVVLTGITEDGLVLVNDPYGPNYQKPLLKDGYINGFSPEMLKTGFGGAWIYTSYAPTEHGESRYGSLELTEDEKYLMASIIWLEARGESFEGQQAVAEIILNRFTSGKFGKSIESTIKAEGQFRTTKFLDDAKPGELQYKAIEKAMYGPSVLPLDVYFFARKAPNGNVWGQIGRHVFCYGE